MEKATMGIAHGGGQRFKKDSDDYRAMLDWVKAGAVYGEAAQSDSARLVKLDQAYTYPVESFVLSPQGEILACLAANDISSDQDYVDFLELAATAR